MCKNTTDCERVMDKGWKNRSTGATLMNADSSRSHSIFTIHLERCETDAKGKEHICVLYEKVVKDVSANRHLAVLFCTV